MSSYVGPEYVPNAAVKYFAKNPRFGHSNDPTLLFEGDDRMDYIMGTVFIGAFTLSLFILGFTLIAVFKCLGKRVGFLSGRRFKHDNNIFQTSSKRPTIVRWVIIFCFIMILTMCIIWPVAGTKSVFNAITNIKSGLSDLQTLGEEVVTLATSLMENGDSSIVTRDTLVAEINSGICPNQPGLFTDVEDSANALVVALGALGDFSSGPISDLKSSFEDTFTGALDSVEGTMDTVEKYASYTAYLTIPFAFLSFIFAFGAFLSLRGMDIKSYFCFQTWVALPLWMIFIFVATIVGSAIGIVGVLNADVCFANGSPEGSIMKIIDSNNPLEGTSASAMEYYLFGCRSVNPFTDLSDYSDQLQDAITNINDLKANIQDQKATLDVACGKDFDGFLTTLTDVKSVFVDLGTLNEDAIDLSSCERINKIYQNLSYKVACGNVTNAIGTLFGLLAVTSIFGLVMLLLRAGSWPSIEVSPVNGVAMKSFDSKEKSLSKSKSKSSKEEP